MADTHDLFQRYHDKIQLSDTKEESLRSSHDAVRAKITKHFTDVLNVSAPTFCGQGSYSMRTLINPLDGEYDIDDGVYLTHVGEDRSSWPTPETVHGWIVAATTGHTAEDPIDKARCVRVRYKGQYHIDLPIYAESASRPYLFEKKKEPSISDPTELTSWFSERVGESGDQLRRLVRYLKAWRDYQRDGLSIAKGLALTILAAQNVRADDRDDVALAETVGAIATVLEAGAAVLKPVAPFDNLSAGWTGDQRKAVVNALKVLGDRGRDACAADASRKDASWIWNRQLGDRFPTVDDDLEKQENARRTLAPAILPSTDGRSA